jgi:hypothetical protein
MVGWGTISQSVNRIKCKASVTNQLLLSTKPKDLCTYSKMDTFGVEEISVVTN